MTGFWDVAPCSLFGVDLGQLPEDSHLHTLCRENLKSHSSYDRLVLGLFSVDSHFICMTVIVDGQLLSLGNANHILVYSAVDMSRFDSFGFRNLMNSPVFTSGHSMLDGGYSY
jgi:hypothetical protein